MCFVNNNPMWHPPMSNANLLVPHHLHAVDVPLPPEHKLYHEIEKAFRADSGKQIGTRLSGIWMNLVAYCLNRPVFLPRIIFIWAAQSRYQFHRYSGPECYQSYLTSWLSKRRYISEAFRLKRKDLTTSGQAEQKGTR